MMDKDKFLKGLSHCEIFFEKEKISEASIVNEAINFFASGFYEMSTRRRTLLHTGSIAYDAVAVLLSALADVLVFYVKDEDFLVNLGIYLHAVVLDEFASGLEVAFALDALHFLEQLAKEVAKLLVVVNLDIGLATTLNELDYLVLFALLQAPLADELAVAHVALLDVLARLDAGELGEQTVHDVLVILSLIGVRIVEDAQFYQFGVTQVVESEEVGTAFLEGCTVGLEGIGVNTGEQLARSVAQALVQVGVQLVG